MSDEVPPEVTAAAERLSKLEEHPIVRPAPIPEVFKAIMANHKRRYEILTKGQNITREEWRELGSLRKDMKENLIPSAEKALSWNQDKGHRS